MMMHAYSIPRASRVHAVLTNAIKIMCHVAPKFLGFFLSLYGMVVEEKKLFFAFLSIYYSESFFSISQGFFYLLEHSGA